MKYVVAVRRKCLSQFALIWTFSCIAFVGCKSDDKKQAAEPTTTKTAPAANYDATPSPPPEDTKSDYFRIEVMHTVPKPDDPVVVSFPSIKVVSAKFDPANLEGAVAELQLDLGTLVTGNTGRDKHLKEPDFFEIEKYPLATITIDSVKKREDGSFGAQAKVALHGETKTWPVVFTIVDTTDKTITIEATHKFDRNDFKVGDADTKSIAGPVKAKLRVTLTPTT